MKHGGIVMVISFLKTKLMQCFSFLGGLVKSDYRVDVSRCFNVDISSKINRIAVRKTMVEWLESYVGPVVKRFLDGTPTAGEGWKFITRSELASIEHAGMGLGQPVFGQTYKEKIYLVFDDEAQAMHFKLAWSDKL
jgi:hypothetical protein